MFLVGLVQINLLKLFLTFELSSVILGVMPILVLTSADSERNSLYTRQKNFTLRIRNVYQWIDVYGYM